MSLAMRGPCRPPPPSPQPTSSRPPSHLAHSLPLFRTPPATEPKDDLRDDLCHSPSTCQRLMVAHLGSSRTTYFFHPAPLRPNSPTSPPLFKFFEVLVLPSPVFEAVFKFCTTQGVVETQLLFLSLFLCNACCRAVTF